MKMFGKSFLYLASSAIALCGLIAPANASSFSFNHKLTAPDGEWGDFFSTAMAIDGNYALIGAFGDDDKGSMSGSAYLFDTTTGNLLHKLTAPDGERYDSFGQSLAVHGNQAFIGTFGDDDRGTMSGSTYLFDTTTGNFLRKLTAPDGVAYDDFGVAVAADGNYALIGASGDDDNVSNSGSAYLFNTTTGGLLHKLTASDGASYDFFGRNLAIDGNYALIGASGDDDKGRGSGSAYLFDTTTGNLLHKLTAPDGVSSDLFGASLAVEGDYALIGAYNDNNQKSSAYLFDTTTGDLLHQLTAPDGVSENFFSRSLALTGNYALVGAQGDNNGHNGTGSVYLFDTLTGTLLEKLTAPDGAMGRFFGRSLAVDGDSVLVGASDSAYLFNLAPQPTPEPDPKPTPDPDPTDSTSEPTPDPDPEPTPDPDPTGLIPQPGPEPESVPEPASLLGLLTLGGLGATSLVKRKE